MNTKNIPLNLLEVAPENVRTMPAGDEADAELAASIKAHGLLQNLVVRAYGPLQGDRTTEWAVVAGGRRLAALQAFAASGEIAADHPVPCTIIIPEDAVELSLAENVIRVAMHPADQITAFARLESEEISVADIAERFGVSERLVEQRLRLARVVPVILDAYRDGALDLETLKAFAVSANHGLQKSVWEKVGGGEVRPSAWQVRRLMTEDRIPGDAALARFVGIEAYEERGGAVDRDLFSDDADGRGTWLVDADMLHTLALEKMRPVAEKATDLWKWAEAVVEVDWSEMARYGRIHPEPSEPTADERAEIERLRMRMAELMGMDEDDWTDALAEESHGIEVRLDEIEQEIDGRAVYKPEDFAVAGCIITIDREGELAVYDGLVRPEDMPDPDQPEEAKDRIRGPAVKGAPPVNKEAEARKDAGMNAGLADDLRCIRTTLVKAHLERDFSTAFDLLLFQMARQVLGWTGRGERSALGANFQSSPDRPASRLNDPDFEAWSPGETRRVSIDSLSLEWLQEADDQKAFSGLRDLPEGAKRDIFAVCVAQCVKGQLNFEATARPELEEVIDFLGIEFETEVPLKADLLWSRLPKAKLLEIAGWKLGEEWVQKNSGLKKGDLAAAMEEAFNGLGSPNYAPAGFRALSDDDGSDDE